jgi:serine/threonine protein kinase
MAHLPDDPGTSTDPEAAALERGLAAAFAPGPQPPAGPPTEPPTGVVATDDDRTIGGESLIPGASAKAAGPRPLAEGPGSRIGPYKLLQQVGEGGMGVVFMAEQEKPVRRKVALKIIKAGMDSELVVARFEAERQALALMDHPNIARVLDAGATDTGRPYFVMELVHGVPITQFCDDARLTPRERLELIIPVCQAIQHAHQKGVIHRDVKPSNVLVTVVDGKPVPKVIDFGIAKAIDQRLTECTLFTQFGAIVGTPEYMSPEQAEMGGVDVDTRSDVYGLGVLLYELLTGSTPLTRQTLRAAGYVEILRRIREEEPPRPSARLSDSRDALASISAGRRLEPARLTKLVRGELDWIVMKALEKDRRRRYETASALAADLGRYLDGDPVEAGPPSATYRLRRYARKHRVLLTTAAAFLGLLVLGAAVSTWQAVRATRAERLAVAQRDRAELNLGFARTVVDEMYTQVAEKLEDQKEMDAYQREILEKALKFYQQFVQPQSHDPQAMFEGAQAGIRAGAIRSRLGKTGEAEQAYQQAIVALSGLASHHPADPAYRDALARAHHELGAVFFDEERWPESQREYQEAAALWDALAREQPEIAQYRSKLADVYGRLGRLFWRQSRLEEAGAEFRQALDAAERLAQEDPEVTTYQESLAEILSRYANLQKYLDNLPASEAAFARAVAIRDNLARNHHEATKYQLGLGNDLGYLGHTLAMQRKFPQGEKVLNRSIAILEKLASDHPQDLKTAGDLANAYHGMSDTSLLRGDVRSATEWSGRAIELFRSLARHDPRNRFNGRTRLWVALAGRAEALMRLGRYAEAVADYGEAVELTHGLKEEERFRAYQALTKARLGDLSALTLLGDQVRETVKVLGVCLFNASTDEFGLRSCLGAFF